METLHAELPCQVLGESHTIFNIDTPETAEQELVHGEASAPLVKRNDDTVNSIIAADGRDLLEIPDHDRFRPVDRPVLPSHPQSQRFHTRPVHDQ